jgi:hypothetical protein
MIRLASEIGIDDLFAMRRVAMFVGRFGGGEDRIDLRKHFRIIVLKIVVSPNVC